MADNTTIRIGGVPEHFNYPFTLAQERGLYKKHGVKVEFVIQKCGTGAMIQALKNKEQDIVVALTEGLVADIAKGSNLKLLGTYVASSLCWAISAGAKNDKINSVDDLKGATFAVSRYGSGSHLMAGVLASTKGWGGSDAVNFKVVGAFKALRDSVNAQDTDVFMWEHFTTKPFFDSKEVKRVGEIYTPWPCFMLAARADVAKAKADAFKRVLAAVGEAAEIFHRETKTMPKFISEKYKLKVEDAHEWYQGVNIVATPMVPAPAIKTALKALQTSGVLTPENYPKPKPLQEFVFEELASLSDSKLLPSPKPIVVAYWKIRGLSAPLRMMCSYANCNWQSVDYPAEMAEDGTVVKDCWFKDAKPFILPKCPILNLPYVVVPETGEVITQSVACIFYLAQRLNLQGPDKSHVGLAKMMQLVCEAQDLRNAGVKTFYGRVGAESYMKGSIPNHYSKMEKWLTSHKHTFLLADTPTAPDFHFWEMVDQNETFATEMKVPSFLTPYPAIQKYHKDFRALPELKGYFSGPFYKYDCNNPHAKYPMAYKG